MIWPCCSTLNSCSSCEVAHFTDLPIQKVNVSYQQVQKAKDSLNRLGYALYCLGWKSWMETRSWTEQSKQHKEFEIEHRWNSKQPSKQVNVLTRLLPHCLLSHQDELYSYVDVHVLSLSLFLHVQFTVYAFASMTFCQSFYLCWCETCYRLYIVYFIMLVSALPCYYIIVIVIIQV